MKKKLVAAALILLLVCGMAGGTTAFYTTIGEATNVITTGGIEVVLQEWADEDGTPFVDVINVMPTQEVTKIVTAKNVGPNAAWVRMRLEKTLQLAEGVEGEADPDLVLLDINTADWTEKDGWYYCNVQLQPGVTSAPLFTKVVCSADMGNMYQKSTATVYVVMQAVQVANNGASVLEAAGWPVPAAE